MLWRGFGAERCTGEEMEVEVVDGLAGVGAGVEGEPIALLGDAELLPYCFGKQQHPANQWSGFCGNIGGGFENVFRGDD